ncbi:MAG: metallophosphoesterase family protein [Rhodospirillaceae bacterium]
MPTSKRSKSLCIGVISDTHGLLRPQAMSALLGVDAILHAGDIGSAAILDELRTIAPVAAIRGNNDRAAWARDIPEHCVVEYGVARIYILHDRNELRRYPAPDRCNVIVTGHSHKPLVERRDDVLYVNPGSAGPRRFTLPVSVALLHVGATIEARIVELAV